jgi:hypothetical protein
MLTRAYGAYARQAGFSKEFAGAAAAVWLFRLD